MLERLPSVIRNNNFDKKGFVKHESGNLLVPAYIGSQLGFSAQGKKFLDQEFYPELTKRGVLPLCPFTACSEYLPLCMCTLNNSNSISVEVFTSHWNEFNWTIGRVNYETLMPYSKFMIALFDGGHACDDGLCAEVGYFAPKHGPIIGIRSDFRLSENIAAPINPAVRYFIDNGPYKGQFFSGPNAYQDGLQGIERLAFAIKRRR